MIEESVVSAAGNKFILNAEEFERLINGRALAPNTPETFAAVKPELEVWLQQALGHSEFSLEHQSAPRSRFGVSVKVAKTFDLAALIEAAA